MTIISKTKPDAKQIVWVLGRIDGMLVHLSKTQGSWGTPQDWQQSNILPVTSWISHCRSFTCQVTACVNIARKKDKMQHAHSLERLENWHASHNDLILAYNLHISLPSFLLTILAVAVAVIPFPYSSLFSIYHTKCNLTNTSPPAHACYWLFTIR